MIYTGETASYTLQQNLENRKSKKCRGYFLEENVWIAFDNSTENCWVEEFDTEEKAICWLENFFEISETKNFKVLKITNELIFIPKSGYLHINSQNDKITSHFYPLTA